MGGIPIEQVFVDLDALVLELGENKQLTATYEPSDATQYSTILDYQQPIGCNSE